ACGVRTSNGSIGMDEDGRPLTDIVELAQGQGLAVGVVTTDALSGATPGAFTAHAASRRSSGIIASQQISKRITVLLGGGGEDYDLDAAKKAGYFVMTRKKDLLSPAAQKKNLWLGIFSSAEIPYVDERTPDTPSLKDMTRAALGKLARNDRGFFLMVEGGRIDHAAHANKTPRVFDEVLDFDAAVGAVLEFVKAHPDTTLFLTADHETGGVGLTKKEAGEYYPTAEDFEKGRGLHWLSKDHTAAPVLLVGVGADAASVNGWHDNTDLFQLVKDAFGL
ncbi:MAG TPA: alkaline phosphatase, partial [Elusimicrobiota bacterium]|nr:alkaline phosphatase [Elusimicrobiota bacterium]